MLRRLLFVVLVAAVLVVTACSPGPSASPSPSAPFADKAAAFAAAEATYRAYVDALNQVVLSDPATFEPVFALTTGEANAESRKSLSRMHAAGWQVSGKSRILSLRDASTADDTVIAACVDVSDVKVVDTAGASVVSSDRPDTQSMKIVTIAASSSPPRMLISALNGNDAKACEK